MAKTRWGVAIDFDGVIHSYTSGWTDAYTIDDPPMPGAIDWLKSLIDDDSYDIYIYTARLGHDADAKRAKQAILHWLKKFGLTKPYRSKLKFAEGKPPCIIFIDDRAWQFTGELPGVEQIKHFKPWRLGRGHPIVTEVEWWPIRHRGDGSIDPKRCNLPEIPEGKANVAVLYATDYGLTGRGFYTEDGEFFSDDEEKTDVVTHWAYAEPIFHPDPNLRRA